MPEPAQIESWKRIMYESSTSTETGEDGEALHGCARKEGGPCSCHPYWVTGNMHLFTR